MGNKKDCCYIIHTWMATKLNLKGIDKEVYAIVYSFSKDNQGSYHGSVSHIANMIGSARPTISNSLKKLVKMGLLKKREVFENNQKFNYYSIPCDEKSHPL